MDVGIRMILIFIGAILLVGIVWDIFRKKKLHIEEDAKDKTHNTDLLPCNTNNARFNNNNDAKLIEPTVSLNNNREKESKINNNDLEKDFFKFEFKPKKNLETDSSYNFDSRLSVEPAKLTTASSTKNIDSKIETISISIVAKENSSFSGKKLSEALEATNMYYGKMKIFHRYKYNDGTGCLLFSLALAVEPGFFDISTMYSNQFKGVTLFFVVNNVDDPEESLDAMLKTAKQLSFRLNGDLFDKNYNPLTINDIEDYKDSLKSLVC